MEGGLLDKNATGPQVAARTLALKNAAPDEWRDKQVHQLTGGDPAAGDKPIQTEIKVTLVRPEK